MLARGGGRSMGEIAYHTALPAPTATRVVDRLVDARLAYRRTDPVDRRRVLVHLAPPRARRRRPDLRTGGTLAAGPLGGTHTPERAQLAELLEALATARRNLTAPLTPPERVHPPIRSSHSRPRSHPGPPRPAAHPRAAASRSPGHRRHQVGHRHPVRGAVEHATGSPAATVAGALDGQVAARPSGRDEALDQVRHVEEAGEHPARDARAAHHQHRSPTCQRSPITAPEQSTPDSVRFSPHRARRAAAARRLQNARSSVE